ALVRWEWPALRSLWVTSDGDAEVSGEAMLALVRRCDALEDLRVHPVAADTLEHLAMEPRVFGLGLLDLDFAHFDDDNGRWLAENGRGFRSLRRLHIGHAEVEQSIAAAISDALPNAVLWTGSPVP